jgi:hypothetical protein
MLGGRRCIGGAILATAGGRGAAIRAPKNDLAPRNPWAPTAPDHSPSRLRFRPPIPVTFAFRLRPSGSTSSYSRPVLDAGGTLGAVGRRCKSSRAQLVAICEAFFFPHFHSISCSLWITGAPLRGRGEEGLQTGRVLRGPGESRRGARERMRRDIYVVASWAEASRMRSAGAPAGAARRASVDGGGRRGVDALGQLDITRVTVRRPSSEPTRNALRVRIHSRLAPRRERSCFASPAVGITSTAG